MRAPLTKGGLSFLNPYVDHIGMASLLKQCLTPTSPTPATGLRRVLCRILPVGSITGNIPDGNLVGGALTK